MKQILSMSYVAKSQAIYLQNYRRVERSISASSSKDSIVHGGGGGGVGSFSILDLIPYSLLVCAINRPPITEIKKSWYPGHRCHFSIPRLVSLLTRMEDGY